MLLFKSNTAVCHIDALYVNESAELPWLELLPVLVVSHVFHSDSFIEERSTVTAHCLMLQGLIHHFAFQVLMKQRNSWYAVSNSACCFERCITASASSRNDVTV